MGCAQQGWSCWIYALWPVPVHVLLSLGGNFGSENRSPGCLGLGWRLLCSCSLVVKACQCADTGAPSCLFHPSWRMCFGVRAGSCAGLKQSKSTKDIYIYFQGLSLVSLVPEDGDFLPP